MKQEAEKTLADTKKDQQILDRFREATKGFEPAKKAVDLYASDKTGENWKKAWKEIDTLLNNLDKYTSSKDWSVNVPGPTARRAILALNQFKTNLGLPSDNI